MFDLVEKLVPHDFWTLAAATAVSIAFIGGLFILVMLIALVSASSRKRLPR